MKEKIYTDSQPSYMDPIYHIEYNKTIDFKEGNVLITDFGNRYLVTKVLVPNASINTIAGSNCKSHEFIYIDIDDYTVSAKPTNISKIYNTIDDLIVEADPIWEKYKLIKMSEIECRILEGLRPMNHPYIVRGINGALYLFRSKPIKNTYTLGTGFIVENNIMSHRVSFCMYNHLFKFIKNHNCYKVEDLQDGILREIKLESEHRGEDNKYDNY